MAKKVGRATVPASNGSPSKMEAVRKAMAELGSDAMPMRIQEYVKKRFGFDMTVNHISNCKSEIVRQTAKGKTASKPATAGKAGGEKAMAAADGGAQPALPVQATETGAAAKDGEGTVPTTPSAQGSITKIEAVRKALAAKGKDATASQMQPWIKETLNIDLSKEHITKYKGKILSEGKSGAKPVAKQPTTAKVATAKPAAPKAATLKPAPAKAAPAKVAEPTSVSRSGEAGVATGDVRLEDVQVTRELVDRVGAGPLRTLIALFEK